MGDYSDGEQANTPAEQAVSLDNQANTPAEQDQPRIARALDLLKIQDDIGDLSPSDKRKEISGARVSRINKGTNISVEIGASPARHYKFDPEGIQAAALHILHERHSPGRTKSSGPGVKNTNRDFCRALANGVRDAAKKYISDNGLDEEHWLQIAAQDVHHLACGRTEDGRRWWPENFPIPNRHEWRDRP